MTDARERLVEAMVRAVIEDDDYWAEPEGTQNCREEQGRALDAFLAHPDDLIALLVERGALEQVGVRDVVGYLWGHQPLQVDQLEPFEPVYRQVREEAPT